MQVAHWGRQVAEALAALHARGIIHRDLKPENLILLNDGCAKIIDFGLAADPDSTVDSLPKGTVRYMSPEQRRAGPLTPATDVFSLGVVLFELSTGVHPFASAADGETTLSVIQAIAECGCNASFASGVPVPPELEPLLRSILQEQPERRPSAAEVARRLATLSEQKTQKSNADTRDLSAAFEVSQAGGSIGLFST
jgi:serine/threonine-protein kinase